MAHDYLVLFLNLVLELLRSNAVFLQFGLLAAALYICITRSVHRELNRQMRKLPSHIDNRLSSGHFHQVSEDLAQQSNGIEHLLQGMQIRDELKLLQMWDSGKYLENTSASFDKKLGNSFRQSWRESQSWREKLRNRSPLRIRRGREISNVNPRSTTQKAWTEERHQRLLQPYQRKDERYHGNKIKPQEG